jgi:hypothetical protein
MSNNSRGYGDGALLATRRPAVRRRMLDLLRPIGPELALDIDEIEVIIELDSGMIDWRALSAT